MSDVTDDDLERWEKASRRGKRAYVDGAVVLDLVGEVRRLREGSERLARRVVEYDVLIERRGEERDALRAENETLRGLLSEAMGWLPHAIHKWRRTADERFANDTSFKRNETLCDRIQAALAKKAQP